MNIIEILREYGWLGVITIWTLEKAFPRLWTFLTDRVFPTRARERAAKLASMEEEARAKREADATLLKNKIERELREEEYLRKINERIVEAVEKTADNIQQMALAITTNNERLGGVDRKLDQLDNFTREAVGNMRVAVEKIHKRDTQRKIKPRVTKR